MPPRALLTLLTPFLFTPALASADGMLVPGWGPVADQALKDIRAAAQQMHPGAGSTTLMANVPQDNTRPAMGAYLAGHGGSTEATGDALLAELWQASLGSEAGQENGADKVARAFTVGNATSQLANSVYGGPPGAAAYAAWWAYQQPDASPLQALRVGVITAAGLWDTQKDASGASLPVQVVQRTSLAAALGGVAIAAAGGDEQALRSLFFDTGAAVLVQDGPRLDCLSATIRCQRPPEAAAIGQGSQLRGWSVAQLAPVATYEGMIEPSAAGATTAALPRANGTLALDRGWTLGWRIPEQVERGVLSPMVVLTHGAIPATLPAAPTALAETASGAGYVCEKQGDIRRVWVEPGKQARSVCRTLYQIDQTTAVLWNAQQNPDVCQAKAEAQVKREQARGYQCRAEAAPAP